MTNIITRKSLERALMAIDAEGFKIGSFAYSFEGVYCLIPLYREIRKAHPEAKTPTELARRIAL